VSFELRAPSQTTLYMRNFKNLKIWQKGLDVAIKSFQFVSSFPREERYGISSQITRSAVSIPSNVAEGSSRKSDKDYNRFLEHSLGSSFELETQILIAQAVNFGEKATGELLLKDIDKEQKMLMSFMSKLDK